MYVYLSRILAKTYNVINSEHGKRIQVIRQFYKNQELHF